MFVSDIALTSDEEAANSSFLLRPRSFKGLPVRNAVPSTLTRTDATQEGLQMPGLALQLRHATVIASRGDSIPYCFSGRGSSYSSSFCPCTYSSFGCTRRSYSTWLLLFQTQLMSGSATMLVRMGNPPPVIMQRGHLFSTRLINNVSFDSRLVYRCSCWFYFAHLVPRTEAPVSASLP